MVSSWDSLVQAANVMQVTGIDVFALVSMIVQAAHAAQRNRDLCLKLAEHVQIVGGLLRKLQIPMLRRRPETRRPLDQLDDALFRAYKIVRSCSQLQENSSKMYQMFTSASVASKLRAAQEEIDRYIHLIPMITLVAAVSAGGTEEVQEGMTNDPALTEEVQEDMTSDPALTRRPRLSLQEVTQSLALEELPQGPQPTGLSVHQELRRNNWHQVMEIARNGMVDLRDRYLTNGGEGARRYSYRELTVATNNFAEENKLGERGLGNTYWGYLSLGRDDLCPVAIKMLPATSSGEKMKAFEHVNRVRHPNIVSLLGWSGSRKGIFLVYELVEGGNLDRHLYSSSLLTWPERYKIILGVGSALCYLHEEFKIQHGDIKPSNILLDSSGCTKLAPAGLMPTSSLNKTGHGVESLSLQFLMGTMPYMNPEFMLTGQLSTLSDVYSFGIVILEIVTGRRPEMQQPDGFIPLRQWVWDLYNNDALLEAVDKRLRVEDELDGEHGRDWQLRHALLVGLWCAHPNRHARPSVDEAMIILQQEDAPLPVLWCLPVKGDLPTLEVEGATRYSYHEAHSQASYPTLEDHPSCAGYEPPKCTVFEIIPESSTIS